MLIAKGEATLEALGSKNGTYLQGERVVSARLSDGDEIRVGTATLRFRLASPLSPTETIAMEDLR
jgi:pSer/pThr/pTyr-binding forkhead associated (FHA) protein